MKKSMSIRGLKASVAVVAVAASMGAGLSTDAEAGAFALREQSSVGQGASFAGVAAGTSLSSVYWNPATLTQIPGISTESVFSVVMPDTDVKNVTLGAGSAANLSAFVNGTNPGAVGLDALIPSSYASAQITDDLFFGLSVNAPYGMATKANNPSQSAFHAATSKIFTTDIKANIAYRINDVFSVGAGIGATYAKVRMTSVPNPTSAAGYELQGDDWAPTWSIGLTINPFDGTEIGIGYRSATFLKFKGTEYFGAGAVATNPALTAKRDVSTKIDFPDVVTVGLKQKISDKFRVLAGFEWTNWSVAKSSSPIEGSLIGSSLTLGYEDSWYASLGGEYDWNEHLTLRSGVGFETSPIPDAHRNLRLPDADRVWASLGASYQVTDKIGIDVAYSHLFIEDAKVKASNSYASYAADTASSADIVSASLRYQWKPEPLFANDEPFERQY